MIAPKSMTLKGNPDGYLTDPQGRLVPVDRVAPLDHERDALVRDIVRAAREVAGVVGTFRDMAIAQVTAFQELSAEKYGVKPRKKVGGDIILNSFDGSLRVVVANDDTLAFNEQLTVAKQMIFDCIEGWTAAAGVEVRALVQAAFRATRKGQLSMSRVLGLRQVKIEDPRWLKAMDALTDALQVTGSRTYVRVYIRTGDDTYALLPLDGRAADADAPRPHVCRVHGYAGGVPCPDCERTLPLPRKEEVEQRETKAAKESDPGSSADLAALRDTDVSREGAKNAKEEGGGS